MNNLHIIKQGRYTQGFIRLIETHFDVSTHFILILSNNDSVNNYSESSFFKVIKGSHLSLYKQCIKYSNIYIHGLTSHRLTRLLFFFPFLAKKCSWVIWGGDLYAVYNKKSLSLVIQKHLKKRVVRLFKSAISYIPGDFEELMKKYSFNGKLHHCFFYPYNFNFETLDSKFLKGNTEQLKIMVGNSATLTNQHLKIFRKIKSLKLKNVKIYCPLSYGDCTYRDKVIKNGNFLFGNFFVPLVDIMSIEAYYSFLESIDVAIFDTERQQAMGNILELLFLGKKIFLNKESTSFDFLRSIKIKVNSTNEIDESILFSLEKFDIEKNKNIILNEFSIEKSIDDWKLIFEKNNQI